MSLVANVFHLPDSSNIVEIMIFLLYFGYNHKGLFSSHLPSLSPPKLRILIFWLVGFTSSLFSSGRSKTTEPRKGTVYKGRSSSEGVLSRRKIIRTEWNLKTWADFRSCLVKTCLAFLADYYSERSSVNSRLYWSLIFLV